ncbi:MAG: hypothetical protein J4F38_13445 [Pseudomonadales bacterium]|nr:hypothetical protein [Pseudomonadales bacterium]
MGLEQCLRESRIAGTADRGAQRRSIAPDGLRFGGAGIGIRAKADQRFRKMNPFAIGVVVARAVSRVAQVQQWRPGMGPGLGVYSFGIQVTRRAGVGHRHPARE